MSDVKVCELFKKSKDWYNFFVAFHNYKLCGEQPETFGRDAPLDIDDIHHIHLAATATIQAIWSRKSHPFYRTTSLDDPENDFWLIYAYDSFRDEYLLLTITGPNAHNRKEWGSYLRNIAHDIVVPWINGSVVYADPDEDVCS